jgi:hypothetical protein
MKIEKEDLELIDNMCFAHRYYVVAVAPIIGVRKTFAEWELKEMFLEYEMDKYEIQEPNGETIDMQREFDFMDTYLIHEIITEYYSYINAANG